MQIINATNIDAVKKKIRPHQQGTLSKFIVT